MFWCDDCRYVVLIVKFLFLIFSDVINSINSVGIDSNAVLGTRVPQLAVGSDEQFIGKNVHVEVLT